MEEVENRKYRVSYNECIERSRKVHGDSYAYIEPEVYTGTKQRIKMICKTCGNEFEQSLIVHYNGSGCPICGLRKISESKKGKTRHNLNRLVYGKATCDNENVIRYSKCYRVWHGILERCFSVSLQEKEPTYRNCTICKEWLLYSNFEEWFKKHYIEGFELDKDLLSCAHNKLYSPETCVFLPMEINTLLASSSTKKKSKNFPLGVFRSGNKFMSAFGKIYLGCFNTITDAKAAHVKAKKDKIVELANKWKDKLEPRVYNALINLDVDKFFNYN